MDFTRLEGILGILVILEAIALVILWMKKNASGNVVVLEPRKDSLRVKYYWLKNDLIGVDNNDLHETKEEYVYIVEGTKILVSKGASEDVTLQKNDPDEEDPEVPSDYVPIESSKTGGIRPPTGFRKPPAMMALMAIEISVE